MARAAADASADAEGPESGQDDGGEHGDVAARDGDHVIGARLLQALLDSGIERRPVADENGRGDRRRLDVTRGDVTCERRPHNGPGPGSAFVGPAAALDQLDERCALHAADQRNAPPREQAFLIRHALVQVAGRAAQARRQRERRGRRATRPPRKLQGRR